MRCILAVIVIALASCVQPANGSAPDLAAEPLAGCPYLLARSARLGPLCGEQRVQISRNEAFSGPLAAQGQGSGTTVPTGPLGAVNALGQEFKIPPGSTAPAPRLPDGTIDLGDGIWVNDRPFSIRSGLKPGEELPLLPAAKALMASRRQTDDPQSWCLPMGITRYSPYPFRFIQNRTDRKPTHMYILHELMRTFRQVFLDGRKHPPELDPTWFGHSIGSYDGDTLVIDTVGFNDKTWFDGQGTPHTEQLHTVERWTRIDMGHLVTEVLIDDAGAFARPFTFRYTSTLRPLTDEMMEYVCQENNQFGFASGVR